VDEQVEAEELVHGLLHAGPTEHAVVLHARPLRVVEQRLHRIARLDPRGMRVVLDGLLEHQRMTGVARQVAV
jgi:hypothetical protein